MRRFIFALPLLALAAPAIAQDTVDDADRGIEEMTRTMGDPIRQQALARAMGTMIDVVLDMPLAPIIGPLAEAAGEDPRRVDPDATLRKMSPAAGDVPRQIERQLPRAMGAIAGTGGALATVLPQLREAAERMRDALPSADLIELP